MLRSGSEPEAEGVHIAPVAWACAVGACVTCERLLPRAQSPCPGLCPPFQTHPNVDKKLFTTESQIGLKNPEKSFPVNSDVGVLKWRLQTTEESFIPLTSEWARGAG